MGKAAMCIKMLQMLNSGRIYKVSELADLLETNPKLSADEIAFRCGFEHTSSFYHAFRKTYGYTPKEIRRGV